jgi:SAM-dependent methyltransferase
MTQREDRLALRQAYARQLAEREASSKQDWKLDARADFLERLRKASARSLIELGSGPGQDALYFQEQGLEVLATDLTPEHVAACRQKGLRAMVMDVCDLQLDGETFDAAFSLNTLLHLPKDEFPLAVENIASTLNPAGLFYLGVYGGRDSEGIFEDDHYEPKRFFSFYSDEALKAALAPFFDLVSFEVVQLNEADGLHFQSVVLQKPA